MSNTLKNFLAAVLLILIYLSINTACSYRFNADKGYYGYQADGFLNGHTYLSVLPSNELLSLSDPYEPSLNEAYRLHDASLYNGKYYLYWGPFPAIMRLLFINVLPEQFFVLLYVYWSTLISCLIIKIVKDKCFQNLSNHYLYLLYIFLSFNGSALYNLVAKGIYFEAINAAQAFFLTGLLFFICFFLIQKKLQFIAGSSLFLAAACTSRFSYFLPSVTILTILFIERFYSIFSKKSIGNNIITAVFSNKTRRSIALTLFSFFPFIFGLLGLLMFNFFRFGNMLEFGSRYQLAGINLHDPAIYHRLLNVHNIPNNLKNYIFEIPTFKKQIPFLISQGPQYSGIERFVISFFIISPISLFSVFTWSNKSIVLNLKNLLILLSGLILVSVSIFSSWSATRYIFDFIYIVSLTGSISVLALLYTYKGKIVTFTIDIGLLLLLSLMLFVSISFSSLSIREYHPKEYIEFNHLIYTITRYPYIVDPTFSSLYYFLKL